MSESTENENQITLGIPKRDGKQAYTETMFLAYGRLFTLFVDPTYKEYDVRLYPIITGMMSLLPNGKNLLEQLEKNIVTAAKGKNTNEDRMKARNEQCLISLFEIFPEFNEVIGLTVPSRISFVV